MSEYRDRDHIKSYVKRATRMSAHQRRAYEQLYHRYCVERTESPIDPGTLFPDPDRPVVLEIGFGMGRATAELASSMRDVNFLGVEVYKPGVGKLLSRIDENGLTNVRIIHDDAILVLERMIPDSSLEGICLFFPDPWPKKRHHKRRIVRPALTAVMARRIRPGGYVYMVTDWDDYALAAMDILDTTPGLRNEYDGFAPPLQWRPRTAFEEKGRQASRPIRELYYLRAM
jgi:tRNA (guanine-N7-)-methyltransferase